MENYQVTSPEEIQTDEFPGAIDPNEVLKRLRSYVARSAPGEIVRAARTAIEAMDKSDSMTTSFDEVPPEEDFRI